MEARGLPAQRKLTDDEALRRQHRFVRDPDEDRKAEQVSPGLWIRHTRLDVRVPGVGLSEAFMVMFRGEGPVKLPGNTV